MQKVKLSIDTIRQLNPVIAAEVDLAMEKMHMDMRERPGDDRARKLIFTIEQTPKAEGRDLVEINTSFDVKVSLPTVRSRVHSLPTKGGELALLFEPESPENAHQRTFQTLEQEQAAEAEKNIKLPKQASGA